MGAARNRACARYNRPWPTLRERHTFQYDDLFVVNPPTVSLQQTKLSTKRHILIKVGFFAVVMMCD